MNNIKDFFNALWRKRWVVGLPMLIIAVVSSMYLKRYVKDFNLGTMLHDDRVYLTLLTIFSFAYGMGIYLAESDKELNRIIQERKEINDKIDQQSEPDIFDTIRLSLNQLNEYYTINKTQAKSSFFFSVVAIILGLGTLLTGIGLYYYGGHPDINTTVLTSLSGILLEFIGGAYFFMYKKSLEQVNFFFGQLIKVQDTMLAINLSKGMEDKPKASEMTEKIITSLLERSLK